MPDLILPVSLAVFDPLGGAPFPSLMTGHDGIVVHTMAGSFAGTDSMFHENGWGGTESTVGVAGSGFCKQWVPWNRQADACLDGNPRRLSIECADVGENFPPVSQATDENPPLTEEQIDRIVALCVYWCRPESHADCPSTWTCHREGIPARWIATSCERGIGVHRHGIDQAPGNTTPGPWRDPSCPRWSNKLGKICPRSVRLRQVRDIVVPRVQAALNNQEDDVPTYHTIRCAGRPSLIVTTTGLRASFAVEAKLQAAVAELDSVGYVHAPRLDIEDPEIYDLLTAPAPLTQADILRIAAAIERGLDPNAVPQGIYVDDLVEIVRRGVAPV